MLLIQRLSRSLSPGQFNIPPDVYMAGLRSEQEHGRCISPYQEGRQSWACTGTIAADLTTYLPPKELFGNLYLFGLLVRTDKFAFKHRSVPRGAETSAELVQSHTLFLCTASPLRGCLRLTLSMLGEVPLQPYKVS